MNTDFVTKEYVLCIRVFVSCSNSTEVFRRILMCKSRRYNALSSNIWKIYNATIASFKKKNGYTVFHKKSFTIFEFITLIIKC